MPPVPTRRQPIKCQCICDCRTRLEGQGVSRRMNIGPEYRLTIWFPVIVCAGCAELIDSKRRLV